MMTFMATSFFGAGLHQAPKMSPRRSALGLIRAGRPFPGPVVIGDVGNRGRASTVALAGRGAGSAGHGFPVLWVVGRLDGPAPTPAAHIIKGRDGGIRSIGTGCGERGGFST